MNLRVVEFVGCGQVNTVQATRNAGAQGVPGFEAGTAYSSFITSGAATRAGAAWIGTRDAGRMLAGANAAAHAHPARATKTVIRDMGDAEEGEATGARTKTEQVRPPMAEGGAMMMADAASDALLHFAAPLFTRSRTRLAVMQFCYASGLRLPLRARAPVCS